MNKTRQVNEQTSLFSFALNSQSGVPVYRQLIDQVQAAIATKSLMPGNQLPTIRQVAVDLAINPNTVTRAYREMEIRGFLETQQGTGTFIAEQLAGKNSPDRSLQLEQLALEMMARAGANGFTLDDLIEVLRKHSSEHQGKRR